MKSRSICLRCYIRMALWLRADIMAYVKETPDIPGSAPDYSELYERSVLMCKICVIKSKFKQIAGRVMAMWDLDFKTNCTCDHCGSPDKLIHRIVITEKKAIDEIRAN